MISLSSIIKKTWVDKYDSVRGLACRYKNICNGGQTVVLLIDIYLFLNYALYKPPHSFNLFGKSIYVFSVTFCPLSAIIVNRIHTNVKVRIPIYGFTLWYNQNIYRKKTSDFSYVFVCFFFNYNHVWLSKLLLDLVINFSYFSANIVYPQSNMYKWMRSTVYFIYISVDRKTKLQEII